jgi:hypothetical protein
MKIANAVGILSVLLAGQAVAAESWEGRFYPGAPRPAGEIALLVGNVGGPMWVCPYFSTLTADGEWSKTLFGQKTLAEVLPGHYTVEIACDRGRTGAEVKIEAKAGHVYYVTMDGGSLLVLDIAGDEDYKRYKRTAYVKKYVEKYLQGQRHEVKEQRNAITRVMGWY